MDTHKIKTGTNAGVVWQTLSAKGNMTIYELLSQTQLDLFDLATAIGWLARENKINLIETDGQQYYAVFQECYY